MIDADCISLNLPCPETAFTFDDPFEGATLETLPFPGEVSRLGLAPYFITAVHLWAQATYIQVKGGYQRSRQDTQDSGQSRAMLESKIDKFHTSLAPSLEWTAHNRKVYRHLNQERLFINLHYLLNHAKCVLQQEFLPYEDPTNIKTHNAQLNAVDSAGNFRSDCQRAVQLCVSSSDAILSMFSESIATHVSDFSEMASIIAAPALLSAVNVQLWLQYVYTQDDDDRRIAATKIDRAASVFESWQGLWPVVDAWTSTFGSLRRLYHATYSPDTDSTTIRQEQEDSGTSAIRTPAIQEVDAYERPSQPLIEGNGLPELSEPIADKIRFILLASLEDADARDRVLKASMSRMQPVDWHHNVAFEDFEYGLTNFDDDDLWSGFIDDLTR
jgi:hypothetical protein